MEITINISCNNAAFDGERLRTELSRILKEQADKVRLYPLDGKSEPFCIKDFNGNTVGHFNVEID